MGRTVTTTTTTTVVGFTFTVHGRGGNVAHGENHTLVPATSPDIGIDIGIRHLDERGNTVPIPRVTPQVVRGGPHKPGMPTPVRPVDKSLATVLAKTYTGTPAQILAQMAVDYEALEYPPSST
jgi:hypothetical protein